MNVFTTVGISLLLLAIVLAGVRTETKNVARPIAKSTTSAQTGNLVPRKLVAAQPKVQADQRTKKTSLTDPLSRHAPMLGKKIDFAPRGKWTVVHFWATWCGACVKVTPGLVKLQKKYAASGVHFVGVNLDTSAEAMGKYQQKVGMNWVQIVTKDGWQSPIRLQYQIPSIPAVYLVSPEGIVVEAGLKPFADADARIQHHLNET